MHNGLSQFRNTLAFIRRTLVTASIVTAIGLAGLAGARTIDQKSQNKTPARPVRSMSAAKTPVPANVELLRDVEPAEAPAQLASATMPPTMELPGRVVMMEVTAYCACTKCCGPDAIGLTASGKDVSYNAGKFVAADRSLPFGTKLIIPGYADDAVEVIDRGGAIKGDRLDVFYPTHQEALEWGRQQVPVTILD